MLPSRETLDQGNCENWFREPGTLVRRTGLLPFVPIFQSPF